MENGLVKRRIAEHIATSKALKGDAALQDALLSISRKTAECYRKGGKTIFMGNGGSAADAQHMAAEFLGKYMLDRRPIPALALTSNSSAVTAIGNDYGFEEVFRRQLEAHAGKDDVVVAISTSGNSKNVLSALLWARTHGIFCVALVGSKKCALDGKADVVLHAPGDSTPRIQEMHGLLLHIFCELVEAELFGK